MMNMDGEGLNDVREFKRKELVAMGVLQPTEEEAEQMAEAQQNQKPSPEDQYLMTEADKNVAETAEHEATTALKHAQVEETKADALLKYKELGQPTPVGP
jgi:hypothetical protein